MLAYPVHRVGNPVHAGLRLSDLGDTRTNQARSQRGMDRLGRHPSTPQRIGPREPKRKDTIVRSVARDQVSHPSQCHRARSSKAEVVEGCAVSDRTPPRFTSVPSGGQHAGYRTTGGKAMFAETYDVSARSTCHLGGIGKHCQALPGTLIIRRRALPRPRNGVQAIPLRSRGGSYR